MKVIELDKFYLKERNLKKYKGVAPSWDLIERVIKNSVCKRVARFEVVHSIPKKLLWNVKHGNRQLPAWYWHIFYENDFITHIEKKAKKKTTNISTKQAGNVINKWFT